MLVWCGRVGGGGGGRVGGVGGEGGGGGGSGTHKVYGENLHRAKKWNNFAYIWTTDLIFVSLCG